MSTEKRGSNKTVSQAAKALPGTTPFVVRFVPAEKGVQTQERVFGRRAFPARRGSQPRSGESWLVVVDGENPSQSVYFVKCLEQVHADALLSGNVKVTAPRNSKPIKACGKDVLERLLAWNTPVKGVDMNNLRFAFAQKRVAQDPLASKILSELNVLAAGLEEALAACHAFKTEPRAAFPGEEFDVAQALHKARQAMALVKANQGPLQAEILAYGRMMRQFNALKEVPPVEQLTLVQTTKTALDEKRQTHNEASVAAKAALAAAEESFEMLWEPEYVEPAIEFIIERDALEATVAGRREPLIRGLAAFEEYVATILD